MSIILAGLGVALILTGGVIAAGIWLDRHREE